VSTYLIYALTLSILGLVALQAWSDHRGIAFVSGLTAAPLGLLDYLFNLEYWSPTHLFGPLFSIEGMLFSFGNGILLWLIAMVPFRGVTSSPRINFTTLALRMSFFGILAFAIVLILWNKGLGLCGLSLMYSTIAALVVLGVLITTIKPRLLPLGLAGGIGFVLFYALQLVLLSWLDPAFAGVWHASVREGLLFAGYPVEELTWALVYGAVWVTVIGYGCNLTLEKPA